MYESFFDLSSRPFPAAPMVQHYFPTAIVEQARQTLIRIVDRAEGPGLIIGQPGLGKTLLLRMLEHHFQNVFHCIHLASAAIESRKDLLQNVLFELNLPYREMEEGELRLSLLDFLRPSESCPHGVLLLVDEAHTLPLQLLDEIRMITNLVRDGQPRVRLILAGDNQLDDVFADPRLDSFNQRIAARCYLEPLNQEQTIEYVRAQVSTIGGDPSGIFTPDALVAVYRASGGIPRLVNQVCDHALVMASLGGYHQLDAAGIEEAWSDLQQLPGPWNAPAAQSTEGGESIVEFGTLDQIDADEASPVDNPSDAQAGGDQANSNVSISQLDTDATAADVTGVEFDSLDAASSDAPQATAASAPTTAAEHDIDQLPDPANQTPIEEGTSELDCASSQVTNSTAHQCASVGHATPEFHSEDAGTDYYASNVVENGWEPHVAQLLDVSDDAPDAPVEDPSAVDAITASSELPSLDAAALPVDHEPKFVDPFGQDFEEEEVVVDRYADLSGSVFVGCPRVSSEEGRALAAIIAQQPGPQLSVVNANSAASEETKPLNSEPAEEASSLKLNQQPALVAEHMDATDDELALTEEISAQTLDANVFDTGSLSDWLFESTTDSVVETTNDGDDLTQATPELPADGIAEEADAAANDQVEPIQADASQGSIQRADSLTSGEPQPSFLQMHQGPSINDDRDMIVIDPDKNEGVFLTQSGDDLARRVEYQQLFSQLREC